MTFHVSPEQEEYLYCPGCKAAGIDRFTEIVFDRPNEVYEYAFFTRCNYCYLRNKQWWDTYEKLNITLWVVYGK